MSADGQAHQRLGPRLTLVFDHMGNLAPHSQAEQSVFAVRIGQHSIAEVWLEALRVRRRT